MIKLNNDWDDFLAEETEKPYYKELRRFLVQEYRTKRVYPPMNDIFNAMRYTSLSGVKSVILGQDPYINENEAHGLAFSVNTGVKIPPSLQNIFKELKADCEFDPPESGCLTGWALGGVLLLNTVLTVEAGKSKSHSRRGWETFTSAVIRKVNEKNEPVVFMLWGNDAKAKAELITNPRHLILTAAHPSPLAGGRFFGCKHFSKANEFLKANGIKPIDWDLNSCAD